MTSVSYIVMPFPIMTSVSHIVMPFPIMTSVSYIVMPFPIMTSVSHIVMPFPIMTSVFHIVMPFPHYDFSLLYCHAFPHYDFSLLYCHAFPHYDFSLPCCHAFLGAQPHPFPLISLEPVSIWEKNMLATWLTCGPTTRRNFATCDRCFKHHSAIWRGLGLTVAAASPSHSRSLPASPWRRKS